MNNLNLREGIYVIRKIKGGDHCRYEGDKLSDLPQIMKRSAFEPYRNKIYKKLVKTENQCGWCELSAKEIMSIIFDSLKS